MPDLFDATLTIIEVDNHVGGWCDSGHKAPSLFRREGPNSPESPTRFFSIHHESIDGIYCEPCLIIANHVARLKKQGLL